MISIVLPTYNEAKNISLLIPRIARYLRSRRYEIIVVDDNSPDGTALIAQKLSKKGYPVRVILRKNERGLASATLRGFEEARYSIVGVMDADLQHNPKYLPKLLAVIEAGVDMAIGSRYTKGSAFDNWVFWRKTLSKAALFLTRPLTSIQDPLGEFFMVKKSVLSGIPFENVGCRLSLEILVKGNYRLATEIPITFGSRRYGKSKVLSIKTILADIKLLTLLYVFAAKKYVMQVTRKASALFSTK